MTSALSVDHGVECARCGEVITASAWSGHVSAKEGRNFWRCPKCGHMFETFDLLGEEASLPPEHVDDFLVTLLVA